MTTKIRILVPLSGGFDAGEVYDWDATDAKKLIAAGYAEPVETKRKTTRRGKTAAIDTDKTVEKR